MAREISLTQRLRGAGVTDVARVSEWIASGEVPLLDSPEAVADLGVAGDPDQVVLALIRFGEQGADLQKARTDASARRRLFALLGASRAAGDYLATHPDALAALWQRLPELPHAVDEALEMATRVGGQWRREFLATVGAREVRPDVWVATSGSADDMRRAYRSALYQVAAADVASGEPMAVFPTVAALLTELADAAIETALALARRDVDPTGEVAFSVIALGKTGARELNYLSDVDVFYVAESAGDTPMALDQASQLAVGVAQAISGPGEEPPLWELDLGLRPEGKDGALVRTIDSYVDYYRSWAKNWEFQALLKARVQAGERRVGEKLLEELQPLVWQAATRESFVEDARAMRTRVEDHIPASIKDQQIKLGPGGLRDVEFSVQLLQLVHGRTDPSLRCRSTLEGIGALAAGGYIGREDGAALGECYRFLRVLEHRTQLERMRRTHVMPTKDADLRRIGRTIAPELGFPDGLCEKWERVRTEVRDLHHDLFYRPLLTIVAKAGTQEVGLSEEAARERLLLLGYHDPKGAVRHMTALTEGVSRRAAIQRQLMPGILEWLTLGPNPDEGFLSFRRLSDQIGSSHWYLGLLRDSRVAARRLCQILATSSYVAERMSELPESVEWLDDDHQLEAPNKERLDHEVRALVERHTDTGEAMDRIRQVRARELLRSAIVDLNDRVDPVRAGRMISHANDACLAGALTAARRAVEGAESDIEVALVAMGRQGGREASYGSDADVVAVYRPREGVSASHVATSGVAVAQALKKGLSSVGQTPAFPIDFDLRPEGREGPLARSFDAYADHYERWADPWERQALLRARVIAGDEALVADLGTFIDEVRYGTGLDRAAMRQIRLLKARMETERLPRGVEPTRHVKLGPGGLSDVEWVAQIYQMRFAKDHPVLRTPSTLEALDGLVEAELVAKGDAQILRDAWLLASSIRAGNVLANARISPRKVDVIPSAAGEAVTIGRLLGYQPGHEVDLEEDYHKAARRCRDVVERLLYGEDD